jgi:hypothetical protein
MVELVRRYSNRPDLQEQLEQARLKIDWIGHDIQNASKSRG